MKNISRYEPHNLSIIWENIFCVLTLNMPMKVRKHIRFLLFLMCFFFTSNSILIQNELSHWKKKKSWSDFNCSPALLQELPWYLKMCKYLKEEVLTTGTSLEKRSQELQPPVQAVSWISSQWKKSWKIPMSLFLYLKKNLNLLKFYLWEKWTF